MSAALKSININSKNTVMSVSTAELLIQDISHASSTIFTSVVKLIAGNGHQALGFDKASDCLRDRIPDLSNSYICRLLQATEIYLQADNNMQHLNRVSESTFRRMVHLTDKEITLVWQTVLEETEGSCRQRITGGHTKKAMKQLGMDTDKCEPKYLENDARPPLKPIVQRFISCYIRLLSNRISPYANTKEQWKIFANAVHQQLLDTYIK